MHEQCPTAAVSDDLPGLAVQAWLFRNGAEEVASSMRDMVNDPSKSFLVTPSLTCQQNMLGCVVYCCDQQLISVDTPFGAEDLHDHRCSQPHLVTEREILGLANLKPVACLQYKCLLRNLAADHDIVLAAGNIRYSNTTGGILDSFKPSMARREILLVDLEVASASSTKGEGILRGEHRQV